MTKSIQPKVALITGVTGQDGSYLAELLLEKGYIVHGIKRRSSLFNTQRVDHIYQDPHIEHANFKLHYGDLSDTSNLIRIVQETQPDEIYNLGAQSHVAVSFESPEYTADVDGIGTLRLLEAIRILGLEKKTRFYQASTSELYGLVQENPQKEILPASKEIIKKWIDLLEIEEGYKQRFFKWWMETGIFDTERYNNRFKYIEVALVEWMRVCDPKDAKEAYLKIKFKKDLDSTETEILNHIETGIKEFNIDNFSNLKKSISGLKKFGIDD